MEWTYAQVEAEYMKANPGGYFWWDIYGAPERVNWELIGTLDWSEPDYSFDMTTLWRDKDSGKLYWAYDSGCSCPSPFEDYKSSSEFDTGTLKQFIQHITDRLNGIDYYSDHEYAKRGHADLVARLMEVSRTW